MTIDVTLATVGNLIDATTAQTTINNNSGVIVTAFEDALNTSGDQMEGNLDMDSFRILNLPSPATADEPLRLTDLDKFIGGGTISNIPAGGTTGQVLAKNSNADYDTAWDNSVTSVGLALPSDLTVTNSPVITTGILTGAWAVTPTGTGAMVRATSPTLASPIVTGGTFTSPTLVTPALGTPASGVMTNVTGTAAGLTVGNVTTNANMTGPITGTGNVTSITAQTGTGTTFVVQTSPTINSPTLTTPALGTPASGVLTNTTGLPLTTGVTGVLPVVNGGSGVGTSTGTGSVVLNTSPTLVTPILGTPTSGTLTNATGLPISTGVSGLATGVATFLATPSSANLATAITDETGTGALVFGTSPTIATPHIASIVNTGTLTLPTATDTLVARTTTDTLTNKTLTTPAITTPTITSGIVLNGSTSGTTTVIPTAIASGTLTLPAATDQLVGRATTDTLTNKSISGSTNTLSAVPLSGLATEAANTIVGNVTGSSASPTAFNPSALTLKASPISGDIIMIADSAATNALKYTTVGAIASAGTVASVGGLTGAIGLGPTLTTSSNNIVSNNTVVTTILGTDAAIAATGTTDTLSTTLGTGTWLVMVSFTYTNGSSATPQWRLWDGTTTIASGYYNLAAGVGIRGSSAVSGVITNPAANVKLTFSDLGAVSGFTLKASGTGFARDSVLTAIRIA